MSEARNWDRARIVCKIYYPNPDDLTTMKSTPHICSLLTSISVEENQPVEKYGGLTEWNQGYLELPPDYNFTIAVPTTSITSRFLRSMKTAGVSVNLELEDATGSDEFALIREVLIGCRFTKRTLDIMVGKLPMTVYGGTALRATYSDGEDSVIDEGGLSEDYDKIFGSGRPITVDLLDEWR